MASVSLDDTIARLHLDHTEKMHREGVKDSKDTNGAQCQVVSNHYDNVREVDNGIMTLSQRSHRSII